MPPEPMMLIVLMFGASVPNLQFIDGDGVPEPKKTNEV
jgi:hypothetical protein